MDNNKSELNLSATTWNGALSNQTTGNKLLDYWCKAGTYQGRDQNVVDTDMDLLFNEDKNLALAIVFGIRLISRKPSLQGFQEKQVGFGQRDEFAKAVCWLHHNYPNLLYANLHLIPVFGCWRDFFNEPLLSVLDRKKVYALIKDNLCDNLLLKYLPQIRSGGKIRSNRDRSRSDWARGFCEILGITEKQYRKTKSAGMAHLFQRQMSAGKWDEIDFSIIPGKAMTKLMSSSQSDPRPAFERHGQVERFINWVRKQPQVKFTGHPHELVKAVLTRRINTSKIELYNRQFQTILESFNGHKLGNVFCALDTSASMNLKVCSGTTAYEICISLGIVFSALNIGHFKDHVVAFDEESTLIKLCGNFTDRVYQILQMKTAWGSTNFQSVIDLIVQIRNAFPSIPVADYPSTLLVLSDMQFNPVQGNSATNYRKAIAKLKKVGLGKIRIIWWFLNGAGKDFPSKINDEGVNIVGGFDPTILKALAFPGKNHHTDTDLTQTNPLKGMLNFLNQPIFELLNFEQPEPTR